MKTRLFAGPSALPMIALASDGPGAGTGLMAPPVDPGQQPQQPATPPASLKFAEYEVPAEMQEYVTAKNLPGDTGKLLESYRQLEKLVGVPDAARADRLLVAPGDGAKPEEIADFIAKAVKYDVPADAKGYDVKLPEGIDPILGDAAAAAFKHAGVPKSVSGKIVEGFMAFDAMQHEAFLAQSTTDVQALQAELGAKFDDEMEVGRRAWKAAGLEAAEVDRLEKAIGTKKMLNMFRTFGKGMAEAQNPNSDPALPGGGNQFRVTKDQAQAQITARYRDEAFMARYLSTNPRERQPAMEEMEALFKLVS